MAGCLAALAARVPASFAPHGPAPEVPAQASSAHVVGRAKAWLRAQFEVDQLPWWSVLPRLGARRHFRPLAWHTAAIKDDTLEGKVVWNPILRCYDLSVRLGTTTFDERTAHLHEVVAAVERFQQGERPVRSILG